MTEQQYEEVLVLLEQIEVIAEKMATHRANFCQDNN